MYQVFHLQRCKFDKLAAGLMKRLPILSSLQSICTTCICRTTKDNITAIEPVAIKDEVAEAVTGEDLDEMFKNRLYNTETWVKVKEYQRKKVKNKHLTRQLPSNPHDEVSVIAKTILENVGAWQGEVNGLSESDSGKETVTRRLQANSVRQFPFELLSSKRLSSNNLPVADDSGFDVSEPLAIDSESCDSLENAEKIEDFKGLNSNLSNLHPDYVEVVTLPEIDQASDSNRLIVNESKRRWKAFYGTADPSIPPSDMPCGGCGALLHCQVSFTRNKLIDKYS